MRPASAVAVVERPSDTDLVQRILSGDMRAMETLMRLHNRMLFRTARAILRDDAEAEDAVQDAYIQAYRKLGTFRGESKLSTWLVRIAANQALMRKRRAPKVAEPAGEEPVCEAPGPQDNAERAQIRRVVEAGIDALPDGYRAVFVLRGVEELSVEETATALKIPEATVRSRYFRARGLMRVWLAGGIDTRMQDAFSFAGARCDRIVARVLNLLAAALAATSLAACAEKAPRPDPEAERSVHSEQPTSSMLERTAKQGESGRMSY
jgi:RNA polymerase sigma-70 factor (ECF subfamily)